jgi:hypothetical protein
VHYCRSTEFQANKKYRFLFDHKKRAGKVVCSVLFKNTPLGVFLIEIIVAGGSEERQEG